MHHIVEGSLLSVLSNTWQRCEWESSHYSDSGKALSVAGLPFRSGVCCTMRTSFSARFHSEKHFVKKS